MEIGTPEGAPFGANFSLCMVATPFRWALASAAIRWFVRSTTPLMPLAGSTNPLFAMSKESILTSASTGVNVALIELTGPTVPFSFIVPPPGRFIERVTGKAAVREKSFVCISTLLYTLGAFAPADMIVTSPWLTLSLPTVRLLVPCEVGCVVVDFPVLARVE